MNLEELKKQIATGEIDVDVTAIVAEERELEDIAGNSYIYQIQLGWNIVSAMQCDQQWNGFNIEMLNHIHEQGYSEAELDEILESIDMQHFHWDWFTKSIKYTSDEYVWFFMYVDGEPQGACLIYYPKESAIDKQNIFYIEYLAVAPWNKINPYKDRKFKGVGPRLICCALNYAVNKLNLVYGFSLHSLPQASEFYEQLGMINFADKDKETLPYYEIPRDAAMRLVEAI